MVKAGLCFSFGICILLGGCKEPDTLENRMAQNCSDKGKSSAYLNTQKFVLQRLKAPATAEFASLDDPDTIVNQLRDNPCGFAVHSNIDAQNAYGAKLRNRIAVIVEYHVKDASWTSDVVYINGK